MFLIRTLESICTCVRGISSGPSTKHKDKRPLLRKKQSESEGKQPPLISRFAPRDQGRKAVRISEIQSRARAREREMSLFVFELIEWAENVKEGRHISAEESLQSPRERMERIAAIVFSSL